MGVSRRLLELIEAIQTQHERKRACRWSSERSVKARGGADEVDLCRSLERDFLAAESDKASSRYVLAGKQALSQGAERGSGTLYRPLFTAKWHGTSRTGVRQSEHCKPICATNVTHLHKQANEGNKGQQNSSLRPCVSRE